VIMQPSTARGDAPVRRLRSAGIAGSVAPGALVAIAAAIAFLPQVINPDSVYALIWGRQLAHGDLASFAPGPTPHPLPIAAGLVTSVFGIDGSYAITHIVFGPLSLGLLVAAVFALASRLASPLAGCLAVPVLITSAPILGWAATARYDILFAALIVGALAYPKRGGIAPFALLAAAGLIRPEAWVIAACWWLWEARVMTNRSRLQSASLVALAPVVWMVMDAAVTGDPLWSLHVTDSASDALYGRYSRLENLRQGGRDLLACAGLAPIVIVALSAVRRRAGPSGVPAPVIGVLALTIGIFVLLVLAGMASSERYLLVPACLLAVMAAVAVARAKSGRRAFFIAGLLLLLLQALARVDAPADIRVQLEPSAERVRQTRELADRSDVAAMLVRCASAAVPSRRLVARWAYFGDRPPDRWSFDVPRNSRPDVFIAPASRAAAEALLTRPRFDDDAGFIVPNGLRRGPRTADWQIYVSATSDCVRPIGT